MNSGISSVRIYLTQSGSDDNKSTVGSAVTDSDGTYHFYITPHASEGVPSRPFSTVIVNVRDYEWSGLDNSFLAIITNK